MYGNLGRARRVVEGVGGCGIEVRVVSARSRRINREVARKRYEEREDIHSHVKEHAVRFAESEALALGISLAECAAGGEGVLRSARFKVVRRRNFDVPGDTTARRTGRCSKDFSVIYIYITVRGLDAYGEGLDTIVEETSVEDDVMRVEDEDGVGVGVGVGVEDGVGVGLGVAEG